MECQWQERQRSSNEPRRGVQGSKRSNNPLPQQARLFPQPRMCTVLTVASALIVIPHWGVGGPGRCLLPCRLVLDALNCCLHVGSPVLETPQFAYYSLLFLYVLTEIGVPNRNWHIHAQNKESRFRSRTPGNFHVEAIRFRKGAQVCANDLLSFHHPHRHLLRS